MSGFWAAEGRISRAPIDGGVEITEQQYADARAAMIAGQEVTVDGGFAIRDPAPSPDHTWQDGEWTAPPEPEPAPPALADYEAAIQAHLDAAAQSRNYRDGFALAGYAVDAEPNEQWRAEACAFVAWRSAVWTYAYSELAKALAEPPQREIPTTEVFVAELPAIRWPE